MREEIIIRIATPEDAGRLVEIYKPYVKHTAITYEYEVPSVEEFAGRIRNTLQKYPYLVAESDGKIVGYAYASTYIGRAACDWSVETSIYIDRDYKNRGIGGKLYNELEERLKEMNILNLNAAIAYSEVEDEYLTNDSIRFHEHFGYKMVGKFNNCGYKFGRWYDLVWMEKMLGEHVENPLLVKRYREQMSNMTKEQLLEQEIESKIRQMESETYEFPKRMQKKDYIFVVLVILLCLAGIIGGAFLR